MEERGGGREEGRQERTGKGRQAWWLSNFHLLKKKKNHKTGEENTWKARFP